MRLKPLYATDRSLVDAPLTDAPCPGRPNRASISITSPYRWILRKCARVSTSLGFNGNRT